MFNTATEPFNRAYDISSYNKEYNANIPAVCGARTYRNQGLATHHHLVTELVVEGVWEKARDGGESVDHVQRQTAIVSQHHQQRPHVSMDLIHFDSSPLQELRIQRL